MKILLANHQDSNDINAFSGTSYFMSREILKQFDKVIEYSSFEHFEIFEKAFHSGINNVLEPIGNKLDEYLERCSIDFDFIICLAGNSVIPFCKSKIPIVFWHDSTWHTYLQGYRNAKSFDEFKKKYWNLYLWDKAVVDRADLLIYSSEYVAEACIRDYGITPNKIKVIPFGANIYNGPSDVDVKNALRQKLESNILNFTFIGKDWRRKGLIQALNLVEKLNAIGIPAVLNILGCEPDLDVLIDHPCVIKWGSINKLEQEQFKLFERIMHNTHFLLHPAVNEPFGIVLCEANAYSVPVIGTDVEGLKTIIVKGQNGYLFDQISFVKDAVDFFSDFMLDFKENYTQLSNSSLSNFSVRLNWKSNVAKLKQTLIDLKRTGV